MLSRFLGNLGAVRKALRCTAHLLHGMWTIRRHFTGISPAQKSQHISRWAQDFLQHLGVQLRLEGQAVTAGPLLVVANHISWLDILVLLAVQPVCFVSKAEIKTWPLIGWLATHVGTLYIERASRRDAMRVVHHIAAALAPGTADQPSQIIAVFPEGTTSDGRSVLSFHGNLIQAALSAGAPVQPVTLRFVDAVTGCHSMAPAYIDSDTLVTSVWRFLTSKPVAACVHFGQVQHAQGRDRRLWAGDLQRAVAQVVAANQDQPS